MLAAHQRRSRSFWFLWGLSCLVDSEEQAIEA